MPTTVAINYDVLRSPKFDDRTSITRMQFTIWKTEI